MKKMVTINLKPNNQSGEELVLPEDSYYLVKSNGPIRMVKTEFNIPMGSEDIKYFVGMLRDPLLNFWEITMPEYERLKKLEKA